MNRSDTTLTKPVVMLIAFAQFHSLCSCIITWLTAKIRFCLHERIFLPVFGRLPLSVFDSLKYTLFLFFFLFILFLYKLNTTRSTFSFLSIYGMQIKQSSSLKREIRKCWVGQVVHKYVVDFRFTLHDSALIWKKNVSIKDMLDAYIYPMAK